MTGEKKKLRLIDCSTLLQCLNDWDLDSLNAQSQYVLTQVIDDVQAQHEIKAIPIEWLHKQLIDLMYERKISSELLKVFYEIIANWEKENE